MAKRPTQDLRQLEIKTLKDLKPRVRRQTMFGDDNHLAIDAQIRVLEKLMHEDDIYTSYEGNDHTLDAALTARRWLDGEEESAMSADWTPLATPSK